MYRLGVGLLITSLCTGFGARAAPAEQDPGLVQWFLRIAHADYVPDDAGTYRLYETPQDVSLQFTLSNADAQPLTITPAALQDGITVAVDSDRAIPVSLEWQSDGWLSGNATTFDLESSIRLIPGNGAEFGVVLRRRDSEVFQVGRYTIRVSVDLSHAKNDDGTAWSGRLVMRSSGVFLVVRPPATPQERTAAYRQVGRKAKSHNRLDEALAAYQLAVASDPADVMSLLDLGDTYLRLGRYRDAIASLEQAVAIMPRGGSAVPYQLARAYLGVNDEQNAVRVLRNSGVTADRIPAEIAVLRRHLSQRPK